MENGWKISVDFGGVALVQVVMLLVAVIAPGSCSWWYALTPVWCVIGVIVLFWGVSLVGKILKRVERRGNLKGRQ